MSEPGESVEGTALRELREETSLRARVDRLSGVYYKRQNDSHHLVFRCSVEDDAVPVPSSDEIAECGFFQRSELPRPISDFTVRRIDDALAGIAPEAVVTIERVGWLDSPGVGGPYAAPRPLASYAPTIVIVRRTSAVVAVFAVTVTR
jgi:hypothetical protein